MSKEKPEVGDIWTYGDAVWIAVEEVPSGEFKFRYLRHRDRSIMCSLELQISSGKVNWPDYFRFVCNIHKDIDWGEIIRKVFPK